MNLEIKYTNSAKTIHILIVILFILASCKVSENIINTTADIEISAESPKILFLNYSLVKDSLNGEYHISLINKILASGKIKENTDKLIEPSKDDLEYFLLDNKSNVLMQKFISNPLNKSIEYVGENAQLGMQNISLDSTTFSLRIQLLPNTRFISIERFSGQGMKNTHLLTTEIFK